jgi:DNA-binding MarR family transcriptional regulator
MTSDVNVSESLLLDDQLCFALYAASRAVTGAYRPLLDLVMLVLWDGGSCSVKDLAAALHLDYGTLTPLLKRLEAAGYLRRQRRRDDERTVDIALTEEGTALRERARAIPPAISRAMALTSPETGTLRTLLRRLSDSVTAATGKASR